MNEFIVMNGIDELGVIIASDSSLAVKATDRKYDVWTHLTRGAHTVIKNPER